jgi:hypothetical protein
MGEYPRACVAWSPEEEAELTSAFRAGMTPENLAQKHGRGLPGIVSRLMKLNLIEDPSAYRVEGRTAVEWFRAYRDLLRIHETSVVYRELKYEGKTAAEWHTLYHHVLDDTENAERGLKARIEALEGALRGIKNKVFGVPL